MEKIARALARKLGKESILYDRWHQAEFARPNLDVYLPQLYHEHALLLVFFLSNAYVEKEWCGLEWRVGRDLLKHKADARLMLLRVDQGGIPGVYSIDGYLDITTLTDSEVAAEVLKRLYALSPFGVRDLDKLVRDLRLEFGPEVVHRCGRVRVMTMEQPLAIGHINVDVHVLQKRVANTRKTLYELIDHAEPDAFDRLGLSSALPERIPAWKALDQHKRLLIYGAPGAGKTTLLKVIATDCATGAFRPDLVPVFIALRDFAEADGSLDLPAFVQRAWGGNPNTKLVLRGGRALILLDGLDEVRDREFVRVRKVIEGFAAEYQDCPILLTTRVASREYAFEGFAEVEIAPLGPAQIQAFAVRWFASRGDERRAASFMAELTANPTVAELASNPLLLTLLALVFEERNDLGGTRTDLFREALDLLLRKWDASRGIERDRLPVSHSNIEALLSEIAYSRLLAGEYFFDQDGLAGQIQDFFTERDLPVTRYESFPERVLNNLVSHVGILVPRSARIYSFAHLLFQEYLAAQRVARKPTLIAGLGPTVKSPNWTEVWLLLVNMVDPDDLIGELKKHVVALVDHEPEIKRYLEWCNKKAHALTRRARLHLFRVFYFELGLGLALELTYKLEPTFNSETLNDPHVRLDLSLTRILSAIEELNTSELEQALVAAAAAAPELETELESLKAELPSDISHVWWVGPGSSWLENMRSAAIRHRDIGNDWKFSPEERTVLKDYYRANALLMKCLKVAIGLSSATRRQVEDTLFLHSST